MTDAEFRAVIDDFDGFMKEHGYISLEEYARENFAAKSTVRVLVGRNRFNAEDTVVVARRRYIKEGAPWPERKRKGVCQNVLRRIWESSYEDKDPLLPYAGTGSAACYGKMRLQLGASGSA